MTAHWLRAGRTFSAFSFTSSTCPFPESNGTVFTGSAYSNSVSDADIQATPIKYHNVAIASSFGYHFDVYLALAWTMERVLGTDGFVQVYAEQPFAYGFQEVVNDLRLYQGSTVRHPDVLIDDLTRGVHGRTIDLVILGTCEVDLMWKWPEDLLKVWEARDDANKFQLVCIVHNIADASWQGQITEWASRKSFRILTISEHVQKSFQEHFADVADSKYQKTAAAGYEDIPVDVHVPVLDVANLPERSGSDNRILSNAVIQGALDTNRRDYSRIFEALNASLAKEPRFWGYQPLDPDHDITSYRVDPSLAYAPFQLHLAGSGALEVPLELEHVIQFHAGMNYTEYYRFMSSMDLCLPAFGGFVYYEEQASSTFAMAVECNVPILVTNRMRRAYTYANDDRIVVTRPAVLDDIAAIRELRARDLNLPSDINSSLSGVFSYGWKREKKQFDEVKEIIWRQNDKVVQKIIRGI